MKNNKTLNLKQFISLCFISLGFILFLNVNLVSKSLEKRNINNFDLLSEDFEKQTENLSSLEECVPVLVDHDENFYNSYLYCSNKALSNENKKIKITENFSVEKALSKRFHFWKRVYTLWSYNQYVLHSAYYPEVVLEIVDTSNSKFKDFTKNKLANAFLENQAKEYKKILNKMYKLSQAGKQDEFTPTMKRIDRLMEHIDEDNKYLMVANNLRIQRGQQEEIKRGLEYASPYMKDVLAMFKKESIPEELASIAFMESSFNLKAESKVGALGVYQIMPDTGAQYMIVNSDIDERRDPIKSARAAAKLLKLNYKSTGSWPIAITAYNHGVGSMLKAIEQTGKKDIVTIIQEYKASSFQFASKNFYTGFLAILYTLNNAETLFSDLKLKPSLKYKNITMKELTHIAEIKEKYSLNSETILSYNPDLSRFFVENDGYLPKGYVLKVPSYKVSNAVAMVGPNK